MQHAGDHLLFLRQVIERFSSKCSHCLGRKIPGQTHFLGGYQDGVSGIRERLTQAEGSSSLQVPKAASTFLLTSTLQSEPLWGDSGQQGQQYEDKKGPMSLSTH